MEINNHFVLNEFVYLITDPDQKERMVTAIKVNMNGLLYKLSCGNTDSWHTKSEISREKDVLKKETKINGLSQKD